MTFRVPETADYPGRFCNDEPVIDRTASTAAALLITVAIAALTASSALAGVGTPGSKSLGDPIFPQIGNGGYDALSYEVVLDYDPVANSFATGTKTTMTAEATQNLSRFSLDFQKDLAIDSVTVDGQPATFTRADAKPKFSDDPDVTQPAKLTITPAAGITDGAEFTVVVSYSGVPVEITDADESVEGWVRACSSPGNCDGSFTVNEPIGAQSWFPSNNHPSDKATFTLKTTAPNAYTAIGPGVKAGVVNNWDGTSTTTWVEDDPMATYLSTGTVGLFDVTEGTMTDDSDGAIIPLFTAIDSAGPAGRKAAVTEVTDRIPEMVNFFSRRYGGYPFDNVGAVADWVPSVGYVLENQTKPHFAGDADGPAADSPTMAHEIAHQWMGNAVSPLKWNDIWFNEGWATFSEVLFDSTVDGSKTTTAKYFKAVYGSKNKFFALPPARLDNDPAELFNGFAVYARPGAMLEGYRQIVGSKRFFDFARAVVDKHEYGNIGRRQFVREAGEASGLKRKKLRKLKRYFDQWLLWDEKPNLTPADFRRR